MRRLPIRWVIPDFILPQVQAEAALPADQISVPRPLQPLDIHGIQLLPFAGQHWEETPAGSGILQGVPAMGYLVEFNGKRWLFPGDTRTYRSSLLPALGPFDGIFAHLWLGRGCALMDEPPLLDEFCQFCLDLQLARVVLAHLQEFGREAGDFWEDRHARQVISRWEQLAPQIPISAFHTGECVIMNSNTPPARAQTRVGRA